MAAAFATRLASAFNLSAFRREKSECGALIARIAAFLRARKNVELKATKHENFDGRQKRVSGAKLVRILEEYGGGSI